MFSARKTSWISSTNRFSPRSRGIAMPKPKASSFPDGLTLMFPTEADALPSSAPVPPGSNSGRSSEARLTAVTESLAEIFASSTPYAAPAPSDEPPSRSAATPNESSMPSVETLRSASSSPLSPSATTRRWYADCPHCRGLLRLSSRGRGKPEIEAEGTTAPWGRWSEESARTRSSAELAPGSGIRTVMRFWLRVTISIGALLVLSGLRSSAITLSRISSASAAIARGLIQRRRSTPTDCEKTSARSSSTS